MTKVTTYSDECHLPGKLLVYYCFAESDAFNP